MAIVDGIMQVSNYLDPYIIRSLAFMVGISTIVGAILGGVIYGMLKNIFNLIFMIKKCPLCDEPDFETSKPTPEISPNNEPLS